MYKKKIPNLILMVIVFIITLYILPSVCEAVEISGNIYDYTNGNAVIDGIKVEYGSSNSETLNGAYIVNGNDSKINYIYPDGEKYECEKIIETSFEAIDKKVNAIFIIPENECNQHVDSLKKILSNSTSINVKVITYLNGIFKDENGNITGTVYEEISNFFTGEALNSNGYKNLVINFAKTGMEELNIPPSSNLIKRHFVGTVLLDNQSTLVRGKTFTNIQAIYDAIYNYTGIKKIEKELTNIEEGENSLKVNGINIITKNSVIDVYLKKIDSIINNAVIGDFITGIAFIDKNADGKKDTDEEIIKDSNGNISVKLIGESSSEECILTNEGKYGFNKPEPGEYYLEFTYTGNEYNGQNYITIANNGISRNETEEFVLNSSTEILERRTEINNYFSTIDNKKTQELNGNDYTNVTMKANTEKFRVLPNVIDVLNPQNSYTDPKVYANLGLIKREEFEIKLHKSVDAVRFTLADGTVYDDVKNYSSTMHKLIIIDEELVHGATIEIEYKITVENLKALECTGVKILDYLDYDNNIMTYNSSAKLLTDSNKSNADYGWQIKQKSELTDVVQDKNILKDSGQYVISDYLENNISGELRLVVSLVISTHSDIDQLAYENTAEIIEYKNNIGRRITDLNVIPGNQNPGNIEITENDTAFAQRVIIMPPLGSAQTNITKELIVNIEEKIINKRFSTICNIDKFKIFKNLYME